jgi:uncharacterized membrane protein
MQKMLRGFPGKPSHPPLTDAAIGAYTAGVVMLVLGALGIEEEQMAHGALLAISFGLLVTVPTALTGLLDWLALPKGTPVRTTATAHLIAMVLATVVFALTWVAQLDGYRDDEVKTLALVLGLAAEALLIAGGFLGGALAYVYGVRVLKRPRTPVADALIPGRTGGDPNVLPDPEPTSPQPVAMTDRGSR